MDYKITKKQAACLLIIFIVSNTPVLTGYTAAERNLWISYVVAFLAAVPLYLIYSRLTTLYPEMTLYEILDSVFGKIAGKIISAVYVLYCINIAAMSIRNVSEFVNIVSLDKTPQLFILFFCIIVCFYIATTGIKTIARFAILFLPIMAILIFSFNFLSLNIYNYSNLEPVFIDDVPGILKSSAVCFTFPVAESVVFISAVSYVKTEKGDGKKIYIPALIISAVLIISVVLNNILILGIPTMMKLYYPTYTAASLIELGFIRRLEIVSSAMFFLTGILKGSLALYLAYVGYKNIFNISKVKRPKLYVLILFLMAVAVTAVAYFIYPSIVNLIDFLQVYSLYAAVLQLFPIVIWIIAEIKNKKNKYKSDKKTDTI